MKQHLDLKPTNQPNQINQTKPNQPKNASQKIPNQTKKCPAPNAQQMPPPQLTSNAAK